MGVGRKRFRSRDTSGVFRIGKIFSMVKSLLFENAPTLHSPSILLMREILSPLRQTMSISTAHAPPGGAAITSLSTPSAFYCRRCGDRALGPRWPWTPTDTPRKVGPLFVRQPFHLPAFHFLEHPPRIDPLPYSEFCFACPP